MGYLNTMEKGKAYVVSLNRLAHIIYYEMQVGDVYTFATEWNEEEFVMDIEECHSWYGIYKTIFPLNGGQEIVVMGDYSYAEPHHCFASDDVDDIVNELRTYMRDYAKDPTIYGYVCFDPENLRKDKDN